MINYNLQQAVQTDRKTGLPVNRYEYADNLRELQGVVVPMENSYIEGLEEGTKEAKKLEHTKRLNDYQQKVNGAMQDSRRRETPQSEMVDNIQQINDEFFDLTPAEKSSILKDEGFANVKPAATLADEMKQKSEAERTIRDEEPLVNMAVEYEGPDKASQMTREELLNVGKRLASERDVIEQIVDHDNDPNTPPIVMKWTRREAADLVSEWVAQDANVETLAGRPLTPMWLNNERNKLRTNLMRAGFTDNRGTLEFIVSRAISPYTPLVEGETKSLEDVKNYLEWRNKNAQNIAEENFTNVTGVPLTMINAALQPGVKAEYQQRAFQALNKGFERALNSTVGDKETQSNLTQGLAVDTYNTDGTPNLGVVGANVDKVLSLVPLTANQATSVINAAEVSTTDNMTSQFQLVQTLEEMAQAAEEPTTIHVKGVEEIAPMSFEQRLMNPARRAAGDALYNRRRINQWHKDNVGKEQQVISTNPRSATQIRKDDTDNLIAACGKLMVELSVGTKGALSYKDGELVSTKPLEDRELLDKFNLECLAPSKEVDVIFGGKLIDSVRLDRAIEDGINKFHLNYENEKRPWYVRAAAIGAQPMTQLAGGIDDTSREAARREKISGKAQVGTFLRTLERAWQGMLIGAGVGGVAGATFGGIGAIPGAGIGAIKGALAGIGYESASGVAEDLTTLSLNPPPELKEYLQNVKEVVKSGKEAIDTATEKGIDIAKQAGGDIVDFAKYAASPEGLEGFKQYLKNSLESARARNPIKDVDSWVDETALAFTMWLTKELPEKYPAQFQGAKIGLQLAGAAGKAAVDTAGEWSYGLLRSAGEGAVNIANRIWERTTPAQLAKEEERKKKAKKK